ncbi:hypothetical protein [Acinetobacter seifertii]
MSLSSMIDASQVYVDAVERIASGESTFEEEDEVLMMMASYECLTG